MNTSCLKSVVLPVLKKKQESMPLVISNRVFAMVIDGPLQGKHFRS